MITTRDVLLDDLCHRCPCLDLHQPDFARFLVGCSNGVRGRHNYDHKKCIFLSTPRGKFAYNTLALASCSLGMAVVLQARRLSYRHDADFGLQEIDVDVRAGRCVAFIGFNAQGKSTLCRVLGKVSLPHSPARPPDDGRVHYYGPQTGRIDPYASSTFSSTLAVLVILAASAAWWPPEAWRPRRISTAAILTVLAAYLVEKVRRAVRDYLYRSRVVYVSTEHELAQKTLDDSWTLKRALTGHLRWALSSRDRSALAERLLAWTGFRYDGNLDARCETLSGGQRHLVYFLRALAPIFVPARRRMFAPRVDVLLLDEAFNCLDTDVRPRTIRLVRFAIEKRGVAAVVVDQILHEVDVLCDDAVFIHDGCIVDRGSSFDMCRDDHDPTGASRKQKHPDCQKYVDEYWSLERDVKEAASRDMRPCGEELREIIADLPPLNFVGPPWEPEHLERGSTVRICGLDKQRRYNGKTGLVVRRVDEFRFKIRLQDTQTLSVRRGNLEIVTLKERATPAWSFFSRKHKLE